MTDFKEMDERARIEIEKLFPDNVSNVVGTNNICKEGGGFYEAYLVNTPVKELAVPILVNRFRVLVEGCADVKGENSSVAMHHYPKPAKKILHWRQFPTLRSYEDEAGITIYQAFCRAYIETR